MPVLVTQSDVEAALVRPLTATEAQYVEKLCDQAIAKLTAALPSVEARVEAYEADPAAPTGISPDLVTSVLATVVKRVLVNPQGAWSATQAVGPKSQSVTFGGGRAGGAVDAPGALAITPGDIDEILGRSAFMVPGTIRTRPPRPRGCW